METQEKYITSLNKNLERNKVYYELTVKNKECVIELYNICKKLELENITFKCYIDIGMFNEVLFSLEKCDDKIWNLIVSYKDQCKSYEDSYKIIDSNIVKY